MSDSRKAFFRAKGTMKPTEKKNTQPRNATATKKRIMEAARYEFAKKGFDGARVDDIAKRADINKQMLYHYFGNKDDLFTTVLEDSYHALRQKEASLSFEKMPASEAIISLVEFTWGYYLKHPELMQLLISENQMEARHLKAASFAKDVNKNHVDILHRLLERGQREGNIRSNIDPIQLYINIASLGFFYLSNKHTLSTTYQLNLTSPRALSARLNVIKETITRWIAP